MEELSGTLQTQFDTHIHSKHGNVTIGHHSKKDTAKITPQFIWAMRHQASEGKTAQYVVYHSLIL